MFRWEICFNNRHSSGLSVTPRGLEIPSPPPPATNSMTPWSLISGYATFKGLQLVVHMSYEHFDVISMVYLICKNIEGKELATCPVLDYQ